MGKTHFAIRHKGATVPRCDKDSQSEGYYRCTSQVHDVTCLTCMRTNDFKQAMEKVGINKNCDNCDNLLDTNTCFVKCGPDFSGWLPIPGVEEKVKKTCDNCKFTRDEVGDGDCPSNYDDRCNDSDLGNKNKLWQSKTPHVPTQETSTPGPTPTMEKVPKFTVAALTVPQCAICTQFISGKSTEVKTPKGYLVFHNECIRDLYNQIEDE